MEFPDTEFVLKCQHRPPGPEPDSSVIEILLNFVVSKSCCPFPVELDLTLRTFSVFGSYKFVYSPRFRQIRPGYTEHLYAERFTPLFPTYPPEGFAETRTTP